MSYYNFKPYVSVAKRHAIAQRKMNRLRKKGVDIQPIQIEKRKITQTFWGSAWCDHMESFNDYENRLPRGRTYVRNGSVCHLSMEKGCIEAIVSGSELYNVCINIGTLSEKKWNKIKKSCAGKIGSLLDLLGGKLSAGVMEVVCDSVGGLFPQSREIKLSCDCPDWATMCKHVAAVLYGVGARLDHSPEKLFELRGVDHHELIDASSVVIDTKHPTDSSRRRLDPSAISGVFDIDLAPASKPSRSKRSKVKAKKAAEKIAHKPAKKKPTKRPSRLPNYFSGAAIRKKRKQLHLSQQSFSKRIGVSAATISNWEKRGRYKLNLREQTEVALLSLWQER